jgi:hypothetical protein
MKPWNSPIIEEHPGPPFNLQSQVRGATTLRHVMQTTYHRVNGDVSGEFLDSKNQNHYRIFQISLLQTKSLQRRTMDIFVPMSI